MKFPPLASSIVCLVTLLLVTGCQSLGIRDMTAKDQVPLDVKAQPRLVEAPPLPADQGSPYVGNVPFKPKDFTPKPAYDHYFNELEFDRGEAVVARKDAIEHDPVPPNVNPAVTPEVSGEVLVPPQFPPKE